MAEYAQAIGMGSYTCDSCGGHMMHKSGKQYECKKCGKMGKLVGMSESSSPVDTSVFGF